jgi:hypothetical protein
MGRRRGGIALIALGVVLAIVSALANVLFGEAAAGGFGWKQITGVVVGVAALVAGVALMARDRRTVS